MAKTIDFNLQVTGKDTVNIAASGNVWGFADLVHSATVTDGTVVNMFIDAATTGANIFPRFAEPGTKVEFLIFFKYAVDTDEALGVEIEVDTGNIVVCSNVFAGSATTNLGITNNAVNPVQMLVVAYQLP